MRVLLLSDIHANRTALDAVWAAADDFDATWCLGDTLGYGPDPVACLDWVMEHCDRVLLGNHDAMAIARDEENLANHWARRIIQEHRALLTPRHLTFLNSLTAGCEEECCALYHGSPARPLWHYVQNDYDALLAFGHTRAPLIFIGHTHVPKIFQLETATERITSFPLLSHKEYHLDYGDERRLLVNIGSVGQPRDRNPHACYAVFDTVTQLLTFRRVGYNIGSVQERMRALESPAMLIDRLAKGT